MTSRLWRRLAGTAVAATVVGSLAGVGPASSGAPDTTGPGRAGTVTVIDAATAVPGSYVVELRGVAPEDTQKVVDELTQQYGGQATFVYTAALQGYAVNATPDQASRLAGDSRVKAVTQDQTVTTDALGLQTPVPSWGLDRIDQRSLPLDNKYFFPNTASSVTAFVIDTGMEVGHAQFGGRAFCGFDVAFSGCAPCGQIHATHVAGTIGGATVGVAKGVRIVSVNVFPCPSGGVTTFAAVIAGVNYVTLVQSLNPAMRTVANMSLGGGLFPPLNAAVVNSIATNVHYSIAAGNSNANACLFSPASVLQATVVGATTITDNRAGFSNFNPPPGGAGMNCVDFYAPGVNIVSAVPPTPALGALSGTSMAAPHAAGCAAMWRHKFPADTAAQVEVALKANATPGVVLPAATLPNLLLFCAMIPV